MEYRDLDTFHQEVESIEDFFTELAAREDEVLTFGIQRAIKWESFEAIKKVLPTFESKLYEFLRFLRPVNKDLFQNAQELLQTAQLAESIASIQVSLRIADARRNYRIRGALFSTALLHLPYVSNLFRKRRLFAEDTISPQKILVALGRLKNLVATAGETYIRSWRQDSDVFRASNLNEETVINYIELAMNELEMHAALPDDEKNQISEYLYKAKSELAKDRPSWNKIIGALVIVAAITSGTASVPKAYQNINSAIEYILGTSVERHLPSKAPLPEQPRPMIEDDTSNGEDEIE